MGFNICLTLSWQKPLSYINLSIDLLRNGFYRITASVVKELSPEGSMFDDVS